MASVEHRNSVRALWVFVFFWILSTCAYRQSPLKPAPEEPPFPVKNKLETPAQRKPVKPVKPEPETNLVQPEKPALKIQPPPPPASGFYSHKVRWPEETLSHIAQWYTGAAKNWRVIAKANPELDPKKIGTGDTVLIPKNLLTSRKPMPFSFLRPSIHKKAKPAPSPLRPSIHKKAKPAPSPNKKVTQSDSPKLFGPIDTELPPKESDAAKLFGPLE